MKLNTCTRKVESNMSGSTSFTIQNNAKMFKILSSGLYSNKEKAIIRELSCNAYDANIDNGNENIPIEVHLPTTLEPWFSVKDSGPGLNEEEMVNIYTQYGNSTKTTRNDLVGALGLGSKSPFSYTDSFSIISVKEGYKTSYVAFISEDGSPKLQKITSQPTKEPTGLMVKFPVKENDISIFKREAKEVFRPFKVKPSINKISDFSFNEYKTIFSGEKWEIVEPIKEGWRTKNVRVVVQGNIEYPISFDVMREYLSEKAKELVRNSFRLFVDIGDLDISASREELGYDKNTISNLANTIENMADDFYNILSEEVKNKKTLYEAALYLRKYNKDIVFNINEIKYKNKKIETEYATSNDFVIYKKHFNRIKRESTKLYSLKENDTFVYCDEKSYTKAVSKARKLVKDYARVILVKDINFFDEIGNPTYINSSELSLEKNTLNDKKEIKAFKKVEDYIDYYYKTPGFHDIDEDTEFYYVEADKYNNESYTYKYKILKLMGVNIDLYIVSKSFIKRKVFKEYKNKIEFNNFYNNILNKRKEDLINVLKKDFLYDLNSKYFNGLNLIQKVKYNKILKPLQEYFKDVEPKSLNYKVMLELKKSNIILKDTDTFEEILETNYPLLKNMYYNTKEEDIIEYIDAITYMKGLKNGK